MSNQRSIKDLVSELAFAFSNLTLGLTEDHGCLYVHHTDDLQKIINELQEAVNND